MDNSKIKIESIYPLSFMQQGLLFHSISNRVDQGLLFVAAKLTGTIDPILFQKAWDMVILRHQVMRTTVHWENLEKPLQIVHQNKALDFSYLDWKMNSRDKQKEDFELLKGDCLSHGVDLNKGPLLNFYLLAIAEEHYELLWPVHHLLLDGWSSSIILNDVLISYEALLTNEAPVFEALPNHKSYLKWLSDKNLNVAEDFWRFYFNDFSEPVLFSNKKGILNPEPPITRTFFLSNEITLGLHDYSRKAKVTVSTLLQGIWSMTLFRFFNTSDMVHGTTVSGRSSDFPNIHLLAGMYMNVQPIRNRISSNEQLILEWFKDLQERQQQASKYEHLGLDQLISFLEQPMNIRLFDSLFIYENYPMVDSNTSSIGISEFKSGLTSTFPVTMVAIPGELLQFTLTTAFETLNERATDWLTNSFGVILENIVLRKLNTFSDLSSLIVAFDMDEHIQNKTTASIPLAYSPPTNELESQLIRLWADVLGVSKIGVNNNFFDLGGDSLSAVQIISRANKLGIKIAPNQLFKHQSIAELANALLAYEKPHEKYNHLVEIKPTGDKKPLYCLHAGGIHVFSYNRLANYIDSKRPIYAVEASHLNEKLKLHKSIEAMANDFVEEIQKIQPKGPYHVMAYCYSTAVGLEVARLFTQKKEHVNFLVVDTLADYQIVYSFSKSLLNLMKVIRDEPFTLFKLVKNKINNYIKPRVIRYGGKPEERKVEILRNNYLNSYKSYQWEPFEGNISLILTQKTDPVLNPNIISSWSGISKDGLDIMYTEGEHVTLFSEPHVKNMVNVLERCMTAFENTCE